MNLRLMKAQANKTRRSIFSHEMSKHFVKQVMSEHAYDDRIYGPIIVLRNKVNYHGDFS